MFQKFIEKIKSINLVENYRNIYPYVRPYWGRALLAVLITIPVGSMDAVIAWVLKPYMDIVMIEKSVHSSFFIPLLIILFSLTQSFLNYAATYLNTWVGTRITMDLKKKLFSKMMHNEAAFFDTWTSGDIQMRFNQDVDTACTGLLSNLKVFTTRLFSSISLIFVLFWNSWQLSIIALTFLFGALYPLSKTRQRISGLMCDTVLSSGAIFTHYNESYNGNRVISSYNLYGREQTRFNETLKTVFKLCMKMTKRTGLISPMMHFIVSCGIAGVIWYGSYLIINNQLTPGGFVSFITALLMLYQPVKSMGKTFTSVQFSFMAMERVFELLERRTAIRNIPDAVPLNAIKKGITFRDVSFEYIPGKPVLKNIDLNIPVGKMYAFVGNSGGGKSTLVSLLPRFYDVISGSIEIDGTDIRHLDLDSLRDKIAVVFQDNFLFVGTIRQNILLGRTDVAEETINQAIKNACLDEFIGSLEKGLDTEIGERGILLSGGQKQRIAIARAFIKNAPIVILDEATSALDNKSEEIVQQAIYNLMENRTVLVIAHRLSTVRGADKIVVIDHGIIQEIGSHDELLGKENSVYASLYRTQISK